MASYKTNSRSPEMLALCIFGNYEILVPPGLLILVFQQFLLVLIVLL